METVAHSLFLFNDRFLSRGQAIALEHFSLSLVLLNLKWTKIQSHMTAKHEIELLSKIGK